LRSKALRVTEVGSLKKGVSPGRGAGPGRRLGGGGVISFLKALRAVVSGIYY